jgi:transcription antitermination factor NusG
MPLRPSEPCVFPEDLLSGPLPEAAATRWWVLHTRPRAEKTLARRFFQQRTAFYLPCHKRQWRNRGRLFASFLPLFPGYVFLHGDHDARLDALQTNLVVQCLPVADQRELHDDLARVQHLIATEAPLTPEERLQPGTPVVITSGALAGLTGKVLRRGKELRLLIEVRFLQRGVSVEIETWMIEPLRGPEATTTLDTRGR